MPYKCGLQKCDLRLAKKVAAIAQFEGVGLLNKQTELLTKCWHRNKLIIGNIKWTKTSTVTELIIASLFKYQLNYVIEYQLNVTLLQNNVFIKAVWKLIKHET